jgi:hypothetical protein
MSTVDKEYHLTLQQLRNASAELLTPGVGVLFVTQARKKLNKHYLLALRNAAVAHGLDDVEAFVKEYDCSTCSKFMSRVGHLVIDSDTGVQSVYWNPTVITDPVFKTVVEAMKRFVEESRIVTVFNEDGHYKHYVQDTVLGGKSFKHFYMDHALLTHRTRALNSPIKVGRVTEQMDRVNALIRITGEVDMTAITVIDGLFQTRLIEHVGSGADTLKRFLELAVAINILKSMPAYTASQNPYAQETMVVNTIWKHAMRSMGLLNLRSSILGELLLRAVELIKEGPSDSRVQKLAAFWTEKTSGLNYLRTTAPASESQITKTARFLEEGGWMESMEQVETAEIDLPVIWAAKRPWTFEAAHTPTNNGFAEFAERKGIVVESASKVLPVDLGYFINEVLPYADELGMLANGIYFMPILVNSMAKESAKPIFSWDSEEVRAPHIPWRYDKQFSLAELNPVPGITKDRESVIPVLSITTNKAIGYVGRNAEDMAFFQFGGISVPDTPRPALFVESMLPIFHEHRRALEDYTRVTMIPRATTQQSISMCFSPRHPQSRDPVPVIVYVRLNPEGQVRFGKRDMRYRFDSNGWMTVPDFSKFPIITNRNPEVKEDPVEPAVSQAAAVSI